MKTLMLTVLPVLLTGCASLQNAGMAEYSVKPMIIGEQTVCCEVVVKNGKEYASLKAKVIKKGDDYSVDLEEQAVSAFAGQQKAADTVGRAIETAGTLGTSVIATPALGAGVRLLAQ